MNKIDEIRKIQENVGSDILGKPDQKRVYVQYQDNKPNYRPMGDIKLQGQLNASVYKIESSMGGPYFAEHYIDTDNLLRFDDKRYSTVVDEINKFWEQKANFDKLGFSHKRGILLEGIPGGGKSCLTKIVMENMINDGNVVFIGDSGTPYTISKGLNVFRQIEPNRRAVLVVEDIDEGMNYSEREWLSFLDGDMQVPGILTLATTNYLNRMSERFLRPGRFDQIINIPTPPYEGRYAYLKEKLDSILSDMDIQKLANDTDGFSFGQLREFLVGVYCLDQNKDMVLNRLKRSKVISKESVSDFVLKESIKAKGDF